jgi:hypothetical protein
LAGEVVLLFAHAIVEGCRLLVGSKGNKLEHFKLTLCFIVSRFWNDAVASRLSEASPAVFRTRPSAYNVMSCPRAICVSLALVESHMCHLSHGTSRKVKRIFRRSLMSCLSHIVRAISHPSSLGLFPRRFCCPSSLIRWALPTCSWSPCGDFSFSFPSSWRFQVPPSTSSILSCRRTFYASTLPSTL